jgi:hypothetical protein
MLDFRTLLELAGLDPAEILIVRHAPVERSLKAILPWLVIERPHLFEAYQRIQRPALERAMARARYVAAFVGQEPTFATFAGLYEIGASAVLDYKGYRSFPGNAELEALGMSGRSSDMADCLAFELRRLDNYVEWIGKLVIAWPMPHQQWWRWAGGGAFSIQSIAAESLFVRDMPDWHDLVLTWPELQSLPPSWSGALAQWRGIYFIFDDDRRAGYVGSAYGSDNILGRWRGYAQTGHGGNAELRRSDPRHLRFSILQRTSPDMEMQEIVRLEASWKERLHTRDAGLNRN